MIVTNLHYFLEYDICKPLTPSLHFVPFLVNIPELGSLCDKFSGRYETGYPEYSYLSFHPVYLNPLLLFLGQYNVFGQALQVKYWKRPDIRNIKNDLILRIT